MDEWQVNDKVRRQKQEFAETYSREAGHQLIMELNPKLKWLEGQIASPSNSIEQAYDEIKMPISNIQLATAAFTAANVTHTKYQVMEVPAGQGKSRIAASIAYVVLNHSEAQVYMVYPNKGLKSRDEKEYAGFFSVLFKSEANTKPRLHYIKGMTSIRTSEDSVLIVDESDEVMFKNLLGFWRQINHPNRKVVCMTAASDDKYEKGVERQAIEAMGFKVY